MTDLPGNAQIKGDVPVSESLGSEQPVATEPVNTPAPVLTQEQVNFVVGLVKEHARPVAQEVANTAFRGIQSANQLFENRVTTEIKKLENLKIQVTPEIKEQVRANVTQEIASEQPQTGSQPEGAQEQNQQPNPVVLAAQELVQEYGVNLEQNDIEIGIIDETSPRKFLKTFEAAIVAKKARLARQKAVNDPNNVPSVGQRTGKGNPIAGINDMDALYAMALHKGEPT